MMKKFKITIIMLLVISIMYNFIGLNKLAKYKENKESKIENVNIDAKNLNKNMFAFMIQGDNGNYTQSQSNTWPGERYRINTEKTGCIDTKGEKIENSIEYDSKTNKVIVIGNKTSYCYLYFDIKPKTGGNQILDNLPTSSGLSTSTLGDMRRYQGANVKNYICINDTGVKCNSGTDQMYRIIGIVEDGAEEGQIKVIKETSYGLYGWNYVDEASQCSGTTCSWPNNDIAKTLNSTFLNSLPSKVQNKIIARQWYYGDLGVDYANIEASQIYQIESGQTNTTYYDMSGNLVSNQKWQKTSGTLKIGMIYLHDYYWQSTVTNCHSSSSNYSQCKDNGWMHLSKNGNSGSYEWMMSRIGRYNNLYTDVYAWSVDSDGGAGWRWIYTSYYVRPVFYLSSDVKIKSEGTGEKTNPYILDLS